MTEQTERASLESQFFRFAEKMMKEGKMSLKEVERMWAKLQEQLAR